jgi:hypothetical protein
MGKDALQDAVLIAAPTQVSTEVDGEILVLNTDTSVYYRLRMVGAPTQVSTEVDSEILVLNTDTSVYYRLRMVGAHVWRLLQEPVTLPEICADVVSHYDVAPERCQQDVLALVRQMTAFGLVRVEEGRAPARTVEQ